MEVQHLKIAGRHHSAPFAWIDVDTVHGNRHGPEQPARRDGLRVADGLFVSLQDFQPGINAYVPALLERDGLKVLERTPEAVD